jgi:hypothetical protein
MRQPIRRFRLLPAALGIALTAACANEGANLGFGPTVTGQVSVGVYFDRDGTRTFTVLDTVFAKARVALFIKGGVDTFSTALTDSKGVALFSSVPVGRYRIVIEPRSIGDSIQVLAYDSSEVTLTAKAAGTGTVARVGFPEVSLRQARALPAGKRVFVRGTILAGLQSFRDTTSHVADTSGYIRLTRVTIRNGLIGNNPGDSVTVLGAVGTRAGQPTLDQAIITTLANRPAPIAISVTTAVAALAQGGGLDAGLVQITAATIQSVTVAAPDIQVVVNDGSGPLTVVLDGNIGFPTAPFVVGLKLTGKGVLAPDGAGHWTLKPRQFGDVQIN